MKHTEAPHQKKNGLLYSTLETGGRPRQKRFLARVEKYQLRPVYQHEDGPAELSEWGLF